MKLVMTAIATTPADIEKNETVVSISHRVEARRTFLITVWQQRVTRGGEAFCGWRFYRISLASFLHVSYSMAYIIVNRFQDIFHGSISLLHPHSAHFTSAFLINMQKSTSFRKCCNIYRNVHCVQ